MLTDKHILSKTECGQINPVTLAFVGDAVYTLYVKERLVLSGEGKAGEFQRASAKIVSAKGQSEFLDKILPMLTEEESAIFRRGKNAKKATKSKSATNLEYSRSTGFEAVLGYLYLTGEDDRIRELLAQGDDSVYQRVELEKVFKP
ncbi:MAG: ribonuclease III [Clostridia bacterium]|nr:ribonuclease III [Clostridia bacterium]